MLICAVEILGTSLLASDEVIPVLLKFSKHKSNLVREGAIYGMKHYLFSK